jgi:hypothetical protein
VRQQSWFASVVCALAVMPGLALGGLFKMFLYVFGGWTEGSDFLYLRAIFGIETPGVVYEWIFAQAIPTGFQGIVAGFLAVFVTEKICKGANYVLAATITGALYTGFLICLVVLMLVWVGVTRELLLSVCQLVGLWIGLGSAAAASPRPSIAVT